MSCPLNTSFHVSFGYHSTLYASSERVTEQETCSLESVSACVCAPFSYQWRAELHFTNYSHRTLIRIQQKEEEEVEERREEVEEYKRLD